MLPMTPPLLTVMSARAIKDWRGASVLTSGLCGVVNKETTHGVF